MKYKMLVLDLDDTLLTDDHQISAYNKEMLLKAQDLGVYVVLASGRPTPAMLSFAEELELARYGSYMLSYNGGSITRMQDQSTIFEQSLSVEDVHLLYDFSKRNKVDILTYLNGVIVSENLSEYVQNEVTITGLAFHNLPDFKKAINTPVVKCILLEEPSYLKTVESVLAKEHTHLSISISKPFFLEVTQKGIDKAASLARLAKTLSINQSEIIAVGNANNDLSMIEYAGLGVWVDNVNPELRHKADMIVASNNNDGVAEVVERFILPQYTT